MTHSINSSQHHLPSPQGYQPTATTPTTTHCRTTHRPSTCRKATARRSRLTGRVKCLISPTTLTGIYFMRLKSTSPPPFASLVPHTYAASEGSSRLASKPFALAKSSERPMLSKPVRSMLIRLASSGPPMRRSVGLGKSTLRNISK